MLTLTLTNIKITVPPLTQGRRWRCITLLEPHLLGEEMKFGRGEARGETPLKTASQIQRGSASLQSTPTEHWNFHSWPDGAGATPDTLSIAPPHSKVHLLSVQQAPTITTRGFQDFRLQDWNIQSLLNDSWLVSINGIMKNTFSEMLSLSALMMQNTKYYMWMAPAWIWTINL